MPSAVCSHLGQQEVLKVRHAHKLVGENTKMNKLLFFGIHGNHILKYKVSTTTGECCT